MSRLDGTQGRRAPGADRRLRISYYLVEAIVPLPSPPLVLWEGDDRAECQSQQRPPAQGLSSRGPPPENRRWLSPSRDPWPQVCSEPCRASQTPASWHPGCTGAGHAACHLEYMGLPATPRIPGDSSVLTGDGNHSVPGARPPASGLPSLLVKRPWVSYLASCASQGTHFSLGSCGDYVRLPTRESTDQACLADTPPMRSLLRTVRRSARTIWKCFISYEQGTPHCHYGLGPKVLRTEHTVIIPHGDTSDFALTKRSLSENLDWVPERASAFP